MTIGPSWPEMESGMEESGRTWWCSRISRVSKGQDFGPKENEGTLGHQVAFSADQIRGWVTERKYHPKPWFRGHLCMLNPGSGWQWSRELGEPRARAGVTRLEVQPTRPPEAVSVRRRTVCGSELV